MTGVQTCALPIYMRQQFTSNYTKAVGIGMLPKELNDRIISVGNSSLAGAGMLAMNSELSHRFTHIPEISEEISLANHKAFNDLYLEYMSF